MGNTYTASTVVDIVEAMPTLFGFTPAESFIAIVTCGPRRRFGFRLRLDMPAVTDADEAGRTVAGHLTEHRQDGVVLVALSADQEAADKVMATVVAALPGIEVVVALRADDNNVWQYDSRGIPDRGAPVHDRLRAVSEAVVQAVAEGQQIWSSREALAALFDPAPTLHGISDAADAIEAGDTQAGECLAVAATAALETTRPGAVSDDEARVLAVAAQVVPVRDAIWSTITPGTAENDAEVWRLVAVKTAGRAAAGPYALAAFGYWLAGDGARSSMAVDQALRADAHHSMADLVRTVLAVGVDPSTWKRVQA